jgi:hypothetical protein
MSEAFAGRELVVSWCQMLTAWLRSVLLGLFYCTLIRPIGPPE